MSSDLVENIRSGSLTVACDLVGKFVITFYAGMGMDMLVPVSAENEVVILELIKSAVLQQKEAASYSLYLGKDLKYYEYVNTEKGIF